MMKLEVGVRSVDIRSKKSSGYEVKSKKLEVLNLEVRIRK